MEYKSLFRDNRYILSVVIDHLTRFVVLIPIAGKSATALARHLVERVFSVFDSTEAIQSDHGTEFENQVVKELESVFGYKKTRTAAYRPQGNSVLERVHRTAQSMPAKYSDIAFRTWPDFFALCPIGPQH